MSWLLVSAPVFAQEETVVEDSFEEAPMAETKELTRKERKKIRRSLRKVEDKILNDPTLSQEYLDLITSCKDEDEECQKRLKEIIDDSVQGTDLTTASGMTYGICRPDPGNKKFHKLIYAVRTYNCKLSSHGKVYNKKFVRKIYGPGLFWDNQSLVMFCTGPAYGEKMIGYSASAGAYVGITAGTVFGKIGACISVGAGKSFGASVGADVYKFEE